MPYQVRYPVLVAEMASRGVTTKDLAAAVDCTHTYMSSVLSGRFPLSEKMRARVALAMGRPAAELFADRADVVARL